MIRLRQLATGALLWACLVCLLFSAASSCQLQVRPSSATTSDTNADDQDRIRLVEAPFGDMSYFEAGLISAEQEAPWDLRSASYYKLELEIGDDFSHVAGKLNVKYTNQETIPLDEIYFRLYPNILGGGMEAGDVRVDGTPALPSTDESGSVLQIPLAEPLQPGTALQVGLEFIVDVPTRVDRNYGVFASTEGVLALAHFYPMIPVYDGEGWNLEMPPTYGDVVYADVSFFLVSVTAPKELVLIASGAEIEHSENGDIQRAIFAAGPARDFYLVVSTDYEKQQGLVGETRINSYAPAAFSDASQRVLRYATLAAATYSDLYGEYPYREMDLVATPTLALGIEYPGVMAIAERMYDPERMEYPESVLESTVAHEVAHQWFYGVVGNDQLEEPWLDEALAQYLTLVYFRQVKGDAAAANFEASFLERWERVDKAEIPIGLPVASYPGAEYGAIIYGRGPLFVEALAEATGDENLVRFLHAYFSTFEWGNVDTEEFRTLAEETCSCDLGDLFEEWVYEP
jgi:hypothetical protein